MDLEGLEKKEDTPSRPQSIGCIKSEGKTLVVGFWMVLGSGALKQVDRCQGQTTLSSSVFTIGSSAVCQDFVAEKEISRSYYFSAHVKK